MPGQQFATILARTDPFDVAQGVERHIRALSGEQVRLLIENARPRLNDFYEAEFVPLLDERSDARLKSGFAQSLKSNLRAIPLFGPAFCQGVISGVPADRAIGLGEEEHRLRPVRPVAIAVVALALVIAGAAGERVLSTARSNAQTPVITTTPAPLQLETPRPVAIATAAEETRAQATLPPRSRLQALQTAVPVTAPALFSPTRPAAPEARPRTPAPGAGVKTIVVGPPTSAPSPQPSDVDVSDMPQAYTDATPLPKETAPPAQAATPLGVVTPTASPRRRSWLHRTIMHLDPFKPNPRPSTSAHGQPL